MSAGRYTTELSKGQGMVEETLALLDLWEPGMTVAQLKRKAVGSGVLGRSTAIRVEDIVGRVFAKRYLRPTPPSGENPPPRNRRAPPVTHGIDRLLPEPRPGATREARHWSRRPAAATPAGSLKLLLQAGVSPRTLNQVLLLHTARAHPILRDFIVQVYWPRFAAGATEIRRDDAVEFLHTAAANGLLAPRWSDVMMVRVARYLTGCLTEFRMAGPDRQGVRPLLPFRLDDLAALYLAHDLHFAGTGDAALVRHHDWALFGLEEPDVRRELRRLGRGHFLAQTSGDLVRITWHYDTFEEALRGIAAEEFR